MQIGRPCSLAARVRFYLVFSDMSDAVREQHF
jgi:hypothetical protein